jgi:hypothetical protein
MDNVTIDRGDFPCGCSYRMESAGLNKKRLIVETDPLCKFDGPRIGIDRGFVKYEAKLSPARSSGRLQKQAGSCETVTN